MEKIIKIGLAVILLICLLDMPYGYYVFVRFSAFVAFGFLALIVKERNEQSVFIIYIVLAIMFQPFFKLHFGRTIWNIIDVVVGIGLIASLLSESTKKRI